MSAQFHLAFPVTDLEEARRFYVDVIGCRVGRETDNHIDFDMFGHHVVAHYVAAGPAESVPSDFDGHDVPIPHFGLNLEPLEWQALAVRLKEARARFREYPHVRLTGQVGEHDTLFVFDPSGNALEFKAFRDSSQVFRVGLAPATDVRPDSATVLRPRVEAILADCLGRVEEDLAASGLVDSARAIELAVVFQRELRVSLESLTVRDFSTVSALVHAIDKARAVAPLTSAPLTTEPGDPNSDDDRSRRRGVGG